MLTGAVSVFDRSSTQKGRMNALFFPFSCLFVSYTRHLSNWRQSPVRCVLFLPPSLLVITDTRLFI